MDNIREKRREIRSRIIALKCKLYKTDYIAIKFAEGEITASDYAPTLQLRREWRAEINLLETQLKGLVTNGN